MTPPTEGYDELFGTAEASAQLRNRAAASGLIVVAGRAIQLGLRLISIAVLARLLTPEDFGVRALVLPLIVLTNAVINLRLNVAALQQEHLDAEGLTRVFRISTRFNLLIVVLVAALGPFLGKIYDDSRVAAVTAVWAGAIYILNLGAFHEALLKRQMRFGVTTIIETIAMMIGMIVAVLAASLGAGYWALVMEISAIGIGRSIGAWMVCPWRPDRHTGRDRDARVSEMVRFGRNLTGFQVVSWIGGQTDRVLVGLFGAPVLGLYDGARRWGWLPSVELDNALTDVAVSSFSRAHERPPAFRRLVRGGISALLILALPVTTFIFVETEGSVRLLFGDQWLGAIPFMRIMCFGAFFAALQRPTNWIFKATGRTRRQFRWGLFQTAVILAALLTGSIWGAMGIAAGYAAAHTLLAFPTIWFCVRGSPINLRDYLTAALRPAVAACIAGLAAVGAIRALGDLGMPAQMTVEFAVFGVIYILAWVALPGGRVAARDGWSLVRELARGAGARLRGTAPPTEASVTGD